MSDKVLRFFGEADRDRFGKVVSQYPAWTFRMQIENLRENIRSLTWQLENDLIPKEGIPEQKAHLDRMKWRLGQIENDRPRLSDGEKDRLGKIYKEELGPMIAETLFTRKEMEYNLADPHKEAYRMVTPCIKLSPDALSIAEACQVKVVNGMVSRNMAAKMFKIIGSLLGEETNIETLRR